MSAEPATMRSPWAFVPTLYFAQGLPYILVNLVSVPMFKGLGASNEWIGVATSVLSLPWALKVLWSPLIERYRTRRAWILFTQAALVALTAALVPALSSDAAIELAVAIFVPMAFLSATHDIAIDGYYLETLDPERQAFFVGIRTTAYRIAWLFGTGGLVYLAGTIAEGATIAVGWASSLGVAALALALLWPYHARILPASPFASAPERVPLMRQFRDAFATYLAQPRIANVLAFILLFRLGDALMMRMAQPFMMDPLAKGGLGLATDEVGIVYGTIGTVCSLAGGVLGGLLIARRGLRRTMLPLALTQNVLILLYFMLALAQPSFWVVAAVNAFEQLAFGLGISAYAVFLMQTVQAEHKATHYAIATSLMAIGWALPGAASGFLSEALGYPVFFAACFVLSLPGLALVFFVPYRT